MELQLADISTNEKHKLNGFKVLGIFPFYLKFIRTDTHIQLCRIKEQINKITDDPKVSDFYDSSIQEKALPLINKYCLTALLNKRKFSWFLRRFISRKIKSCGHYHILNLYKMILSLDDPTFFLPYWRNLNRKDNTLLSEVKQSSEKSLPIKKKQE